MARLLKTAQRAVDGKEHPSYQHHALLVFLSGELHGLARDLALHSTDVALLADECRDRIEAFRTHLLND